MEDRRLQFADKVTLERIALIHPLIREMLKDQYLEINMKLPKGVRLRFTQTLRTDKEQDDLYALGRTKINPNGKTTERPLGYTVTKAKAGQSIHNYGLAFDIVILKDLDNSGSFKTASWDDDSNWKKVVAYFKDKGWTWGGDFKSFKDTPHFDWSKGKSYSWYQSQELTVDTKTGIKYTKNV